MADEPRVTTEDVLGEFGFRLVWSVRDHWADVTAYEVVAYDPEHVPEFNVKGWTNSMDWTPHVEQAEPYLSGFVKWDGCTELAQGQPHWCGPNGYEKHILLLQHIYRRAFELMDREPEEPWTLSISEAANGVPSVSTASAQTSRKE